MQFILEFAGLHPDQEAARGHSYARHLGFPGRLDLLKDGLTQP